MITNQVFKLSITILITILLAKYSFAGGLGGLPYVPDLHAKCLSSHQANLLECALIDPTRPVTELDLKCANWAMNEYKICEQTLDKLRILDSLKPTLPLIYDTSKLLKALKEDEYGGYPD